MAYTCMQRHCPLRRYLQVEHAHQTCNKRFTPALTDSCTAFLHFSICCKKCYNKIGSRYGCLVGLRELKVVMIGLPVWLLQSDPFFWSRPLKASSAKRIQLNMRGWNRFFKIGVLTWCWCVRFSSSLRLVLNRFLLIKKNSCWSGHHNFFAIGF